MSHPQPKPKPPPHSQSQSPSEYLSRLSIQTSTSPATASSPMQSPRKNTLPQGSAQHPDENESDWDDDDGGTISSSLTGLRYNTGRLSTGTRNVVRALFNDQESPHIYLESCGIKQEDPESSAIFYAFQMQELVPCSVRIGSRDSKRWSRPHCTCTDARYQRKQPCKHLVWLFDRLSEQALLNNNPDSELAMTELGYPEELGDPFGQISDLRLDVLADSLRCDTVTPGSGKAPPSRARIREAREMVATLAGVEPRDVDNFRLDLEKTYASDALLHRGDLEATLFSLFLESHSLAARVRAELTPSDPATDPFRALRHRALRVISELDGYAASLQHPDQAEVRRSEGREAEGPRNVSWAAAQIRSCVCQVQKLISRGSRPLSSSERASAARALVGILKAVASHNVDSIVTGGTVDDRNLYMCLIGNQDTGFVYSALNTLVDQSQFVEELESIMELVGRFGAPESYVLNMRGLISRMRSFTSEDRRRPSVDSATPSVQRRGTPPMEGFDDSSARPSSSNSGQFLVPDVPASASRTRGRGGRGGNGSGSRGRRGDASTAAGSKRPGLGSDQGKGSKRPR